MADDSIHFPVFSLSAELTEFCSPMMLARLGPHMVAPAYRGQIPRPGVYYENEFREKQAADPNFVPPPIVGRTYPQQIVPVWTFIGDAHGVPGTYEVEILAFPFYQVNDKPLNTKAVSIYRGTLHVVE